MLPGLRGVDARDQHGPDDPVRDLCGFGRCRRPGIFRLSFFLDVDRALLILFAGSILAEHAFNLLASNEEKQRDLEDHVRNPPT